MYDSDNKHVNKIHLFNFEAIHQSASKNIFSFKYWHENQIICASCPLKDSDTWLWQSVLTILSVKDSEIDTVFLLNCTFITISYWFKPWFIPCNLDSKHAPILNYNPLNIITKLIKVMASKWMLLPMLEIKFPFIWYQTRHTLNNV